MFLGEILIEPAAIGERDDYEGVFWTKMCSPPFFPGHHGDHTLHITRDA